MALSNQSASLYRNLEFSAAEHPDKPFLVFYDTPLTFADALSQVDVLAGYLERRWGVGEGDRVILYMQNCPQFIIGFYAAIRLGAVAVPVNPMNLSAELEYMAQDSGARVAIVGEELLVRAAGLAGKLLDHILIVRYSDYITRETDLRLPEDCRARARVGCLPVASEWKDALAAGIAPSPHSASPDDLCLIGYTSGTTGRPKGCMHTNRTAMATVVNADRWAGLERDTVTLCSMPLFHITGVQSGMNGPVYLGITVILMQRWDREMAARLIERYRVWSWNCISTMALDFASDPIVQRYDLSSLKRISGGGAAMPEAVSERLFELTGIRYIEGYGLTETMAPSHVNPRERPKLGCLGKPLPGVDARIIDPDTCEPLRDECPGELVVSGPQVFVGYWNDPEATRQAFVEIDGKRFFRTGDIARRDAEGYYFMTDRLKRMINASGMKVWPAEVEAVLSGHPAIQEACVIAAHDSYRGETVKALVSLKPDMRDRVSAGEIMAWCRERIAAYKAPRLVEFVEALPKSATGKVQWRMLQEESMRNSSQ